MKPGTWGPGTTLSYAWLADGAPIAGQTGESLVLRPRHRGARISVTVTGSATGLTPSTATATARDDVRKGRLEADRPRVVGRTVVGGVLRADPGEWTRGTRHRFVWFADGAKVGTGTRITLRPAHRGDRITVRVTGRRTGYAATTRTSAPTRAVRGR